MDDRGTNYLELADWRRQVAILYARVREIAADDPVAAHEHWRLTRERLYREHPQSPVPARERAHFRALHFPYDPALRFDARVTLDSPSPPTPSGRPDSAVDSAARDPDASRVPASIGDAMAFRRIGWVHVPLEGQERPLGLYWGDDYGGNLFLPFRDATNGTETYGAGRYVLDAEKSADLGGDLHRGTLVVDFNFAYHPSCAFDPRWACPLAPPENRLDPPIRAGERYRSMS